MRLPLHYLCAFPFGLGITLPFGVSQYLRYLRFSVGVGVRLAMQLARNASPQARRRGSVDCCNCSKQNSSTCLGAAKAGVPLIAVRQAVTTATSTYSGFTRSPPRTI